MLSLGWDYLSANLLESWKWLKKKKKKSLSHSAQGALQLSSSAAQHPIEPAVSPVTRCCSRVAQQDPAVFPQTSKVRMPKSEVPFPWSLYCFHARIKPESVSDRYIKTVLKIRGNFSCSQQSWQLSQWLCLLHLLHLKGYQSSFSVSRVLCYFLHPALLVASYWSREPHRIPEQRSGIWCTKLLWSGLCS